MGTGRLMKFIELFAGIGGFRYGLEMCNSKQESGQQGLQSRGDKPNRSDSLRGKAHTYDCVWSNEIDKYACQIYRKNFEIKKGDDPYGKSILYQGDITKVNTNDIPDHDLLCAGFPCQAFSIAGKRGGFQDTRGTLFFEIVRIAQKKRPRLLLLENVKGLLSHGNGNTFGTILTTLDEIGYDCQWQVLNSKNFGVPQNRERVFIIGHLRGESRPKVFPIGESNQVSDGRIEKELKYRNQKTVYNPKGIAPTFREGHGDGVRIIDDSKIRRLTPTECERLQGFPNGWTEGISDTQRYKCLGNAVTTNVISAIGERLC